MMLNGERDSFGIPTARSTRDVDVQSREFANYEFDEHPELEELLSIETNETMTTLQVVLAVDPGVLYDLLPNEASRYVLTAAINDCLSLLAHVRDMDGRSAARAARSIFEHATTLCDVLSDEDWGERYLDHRHVTEVVMSRHRWFLDLLNRSAARKERNRLDGLGARSKRLAEGAIAKYGSNFWRQWHPDPLLERASRHGIEDLYDGYRILSAAIHGTSGAMSGLVRQVGAEQIHRVGPDMELSAIAFAEGFRFMRVLTMQLQAVMPGTEADRMCSAIDAALSCFDDLCRALRRIDRQLSPTRGRRSTVTVAAIWPDGTVKWYLHDLRDNTAVLAELLSDEPDLSGVRERAAMHDYAAHGNRPVSVLFPHLSATPRKGSSRVPASGLFVPWKHLEESAAQ